LFFSDLKAGGLKKSGVLPSGVEKGIVPYEIGVKFFASDVLPREALAKELGNKDFKKDRWSF